jgi:hypothetical protein
VILAGFGIFYFLEIPYAWSDRVTVTFWYNPVYIFAEVRLERIPEVFPQ